ncbi:S-layer homology domain-containing protein [Anaerotignum sp.]
MKKKLLCALLTLTMCTGLLPMTAVAAECDHHTTHTEGVCYTVQEGTQTTTPAEFDVNLCEYQCNICPVQALIDALPDAADVTEDNKADVEEALIAIDEAMAELFREEAAQLDLTRYNEVGAAYSVLNQLMPLEEIDLNNPDLMATVTRGGETTSYIATEYNKSIDNAVVDANKGECTLTLYNIGDSSFPPAIRLTGDNITLDLAGRTHTVQYLGYNSSAGTLTIQNGTLVGKIAGGSGAVELFGGNVIIKQDAVIKGERYTSGVKMYPNGGTLKNYGEINGGNYGVGHSFPGVNILPGDKPGDKPGTLYNYGKINGGDGAPGVDIQPGDYPGMLYNYGTIQGGSGANGVEGFVELNEGVIKPISVTNVAITVLENGTSVMDENGRAVLYYNGEERSFDYKFYLDGQKAYLVEDEDYTVEITDDEGEEVDPDELKLGTYYIHFTDIREPQSSRTVPLVIAQSATEFEDGIKTYNDETETDTFTYGDTITVKVTPKATGTAPASTFSLRAAAPAANQAALFYGDIQLTEPQTVTQGTELTFAYDTTNKLVPTGTVTLTVKYVGDASMADHSEDVTVTINKKPLNVSNIDAVDRDYEAGNTGVEIKYLYFSGIAGSDVNPTSTATGSIPTENAGTYDVTAAITLDEESAKWYAVGTIPPFDVEISKINVPDDMKRAAGTVIRNGESAVTLPELPLGASYGQPDSLTSNVTVVSMENGTLTVRGGESVVENGSYSVQVPVTEGTNYHGYNIMVTLTGTTKQSSDDDSSSSSGNGGGGSSSSTTVTNKGDSTEIDTSSGTISENSADKVIDKAIENDSDEIIIDTNKDKATLPEGMTEKITDETNADLVVKTKNGTVTIPNSTLEDLDAEGKVTVEVTKDKVMISDEDGELSDIGKIEVTVPYKENSKTGNVAVEVTKADGTKEVIEDVYDGKNSVTFEIDGSVTFEIIDDYVPLADVPVVPEQPAENTFKDVSEADWFYDAVMYVSENGLMSGVDTDNFGPYWNTTRGMITTILWRMEGKPDAGMVPFADVDADMYYADAIAWAAANGIVSGYDAVTFGPDDNITREQLASILWRYAKYKGYDVSVGEDTNILSYEDAFSISEYAIPAMQWACGAGIISGNDDGTLNPAGHAQRAHAAQMLMKFDKNVK